MMEVVPYPLVAKDLDNRYIAVNRAFEQALGVRREEIIGRSTVDVMPGARHTASRFAQLSALSIATGTRQQVELEFCDRHGQQRHGLFWTGTFNAADGAMAGIVGTMIDITDIRDAEMRARENERRLHDVTRSLPAVVFQLRRAPDGSPAFRISAATRGRCSASTCWISARINWLASRRFITRTKARFAT